MHSFKSDEFKIRVLTKDDAEEYNALLRYAFQVTEADLAETGWKDDEIKQSKFPVLERADVLGCFNIIDKKEELVAQFAVYPLDMNIYGERYEVGFVTSVCTYPEYTGHGLMKKLMRKSLTRMRDSNKSFALLYPYSIPLYRGLGWEIISNKMTYVIKDRQISNSSKKLSTKKPPKPSGNISFFSIFLSSASFRKISTSGTSRKTMANSGLVMTLTPLNS